MLRVATQKLSCQYGTPVSYTHLDVYKRQGHLVELAPPNVYDAKYVQWSIADLPILPEKWQYLVSASTKKQFGVLQKLMHRPDVDSLSLIHI